MVERGAEYGHTSFRQKSGVLAIKEHWKLSEDTRTSVWRLLKCSVTLN